LPLISKVERLDRRIEVMELKGLLAARVAADSTPAAGFFDQSSLDRPPSFGDGLRPTASAAVIAPALEHKMWSLRGAGKPSLPCPDPQRLGIAAVEPF
jgi:hypothetical protein